MSANGIVDSGTLGIKAVQTSRIPRVAYALGAKHTSTDTHGWHVFDFDGASVRVPGMGNGEVGRAHLANIVRAMRDAGVPSAVLRAVFDDVGCVWYVRPPKEDLEEGRRLLRLARKKGVIPTVQTITAKRPTEPPPQNEAPPKIEYGDEYWSGIEDIREAVVMGLPSEEDQALIHATSKTVGRLIAIGKGFVKPLLEGHQIERYNIGTEHSPTYRYRMTEFAVTTIAEYAHRKWAERHGPPEPEQEAPSEPEREAAPEPETEPETAPEPVPGAPTPAPAPEPVEAPVREPRRFVGSVNTAVEAIQRHLGVMPRFRGGEADLTLDVNAYLIAIGRELEERGSE